MEKLSKFVISRLALRQGQMTDHPDADTLAAFAEARLPSRERTSILDHLARCPDCRETLALTSAGESSQMKFALPFTQGGPTWWRWRWAPAVAVACLVAAVIWHPPFVEKNQERPPAVETSHPAEAPKPTEPSAPGPLKAVEKKTRPAITTHRSEGKKEKQKPEAPIVTDALRGPVPMPQLAPTPVLPAQEQSQNFVAGALPRLRRQRITADAGEENLWRLTESAQGAIQRSTDGGKTWETVPVNDRNRLYALSAAGAEIWVGGAEGALFHSADNGSHWTRVIVKDENQRLRETITRIDAQDETVVELRTQPGSTWITLDGGLHWRLE